MVEKTIPAARLKVLIPGAGIAGNCLAYWLSRTRLDISITIVERSPVPRVTGQSIDIRGSAIDIIKEMKMEEAIRSRLTTEEGTAFVDSSGKTFAKFEVGESFTAEYEILRADLSQLFLEATEGSGHFRHMYGDSIQSLEQTDKDVSVTFAGGSKERFDLVVAADGSTSRTRSMILDEQVLKHSFNFLGQYIAFFSIPSQPNNPKLWQWYNTPKGLCVMTRPHRNTSTTGPYLCIITPARGQCDRAVEDALDKGTEDTRSILHNYFDDVGWEAKRVLAGMDHAEDFYMSRAAQVKLPKWTNGRALVIGDAGFATFGIGTSLAIESTYILAGELSKIQSSNEVPQALERYEEVYRPLYAETEGIPSFFPQLVFPQTAWGLWIRDCALWFTSKTKMHKIFQGDSRDKLKMASYNWVDIREWNR